MEDARRKLLAFLSLFTSTGTLLCCALPAAVSAVAGGTAVVSLVSTFPWLITISRYKGWIFIFAGLLILLSLYLVYRPRSRLACTIAGEGCEVASRFSKATVWISVSIYVTGLFFAYLAVPIMRFLEG